MQDSAALLQFQDDFNRDKETQKNEKKLEFPCDECGKTFKRKDHWKNHLKTHTQERSFSCSVCGNAFRLKAHLDRHMIRHTDEKSCVCCKCGRAFGHKSILNMHMRVHSKEKPYACSICGKRFSQQGAMKMHERIHSEERSYACDKCALRFKQKGCLTKHMWVHSDKRPFPCIVCDKRFRNRTSLNTHMQVHSKVKPFSCSVCGSSFSLKSSLVIHERRHRQEKPFACEECGKSFGRKDVLLVHVRLHADGKLFSCKECKICFRIKSSLEKHNMQFHSQDEASLSDGSNSFENNSSDIPSKQNNNFKPDNFTIDKKDCGYDLSLKTEASCHNLVTVKEENLHFTSEFENAYKSIESSSSPSDILVQPQNQTIKTESEKSEFNINEPFPEQCNISDKECKENVGEITSKCSTSLNFKLLSSTTQSVLPLGEMEEQETDQIISENEHGEDHSGESRSSSVAVWTGLV